jgi:putative ABC transport system ATP-binding protein
VEIRVVSGSFLIVRQPRDHADWPEATEENIVPSTITVAARAEAARKVYGSGATQVVALDDVSVDFAGGEFTAIMGPSGSGKSTLMHCIAGLDSLTSGRVLIGDVDLTSLDDKRLTILRREKVGFIFQAFNLIPTLTALENIVLPLSLAGRKASTPS